MVAIEEAKRLKATIIYGDLSVNEIASRLSAALTLPAMMKAMGRLLMRQASGIQDIKVPKWMEESIFGGAAMGGGGDQSMNKEQLLEKVEVLKSREKVREMRQLMSDLFPELVEVMIFERDQAMAERLKEVRGTVVAVVGLAHMDGIEEKWKDWAA
eukprot:TRINITY_DN6901_c0_g1_i1.p1 TRINITY_DN6901_c0_g1~~TRINITY_DN6901_c0_g1_i1.p1  ORF type:complete len:182 (-),score=67.82 TRINITY_DN6901_c0_g1_i1:47-514(-)